METNNKYYQVSNGIRVEVYDHKVLGKRYTVINREGKRQSVKVDKWMIEDINKGIATEIEKPIIDEQKTLNTQQEDLATYKQKKLMDDLNICYPDNITKNTHRF